MLAVLNARGYDLLTFADPIAFRYLYETRYRDQPAPVLIVCTGQADVHQTWYGGLGEQCQGFTWRRYEPGNSRRRRGRSGAAV